MLHISLIPAKPQHLLPKTAGQHPSQVHSETCLLQGLESACRDSHCAKGQPKIHVLLFHLGASSVSCPQTTPQLSNLPHRPNEDVTNPLLALRSSSLQLPL